MAKGGYNKRRLEQRKLQERARRRRERARRKMLTWVIASIVLVLLALAAIPRGDNRYGVAFFAREGFFGGGDETSLADPSATPTASTPPPCTPPAGVQKTYSAPPKMTIDTSKTYTATFTTSAGAMTVELLDNAAPKTVNNFVFLARNRYYDCSPFHRVLPNFGGPGSDMIQGGDPVNRNGTGGPGYQFGDENMIPFTKPGYLAMANAGPGSNGSQFFFLNGTVQHLNRPGSCPGQGCHSVFGRVTSGIDVIAKIAASPLADPQGGTPVNPPYLISVKISER